MNNSKNKRTIILTIVLLILLFVGYKLLFTSKSEVSSVTETAQANIGEKIGSILKEVESINFDIGIMKEQKFMSLKSIEIPLVLLPVGKNNPFSDVLGSN